jgi:hypothetical protein
MSMASRFLIKLIGTTSNRLSVGARITEEAVIRGDADQPAHVVVGKRIGSRGIVDMLNFADEIVDLI